MSLFQNLLATYEKCKDAAGIVRYDAKGEENEKKTFLPLFHTTFKSQIDIVLDGDGRLVHAARNSRDNTSVVPCTAGSAGRTSGAVAHPLCDQLDYVGGIDGAKTESYLTTLDGWIERASGTVKRKLAAVRSYVSMGTMMSDLREKQLFKNTEYDEQGGERTVNHKKIGKIGVRFAVEIKDDLTPKVWEDKDIRQSWIDHIRPQSRHGREDLFDYLSGGPVGQVAGQHPRGIYSGAATAKLLSFNYTFKGRFVCQDDAMIADYEQSQKMHQTLRWLINNHGYNIASQTIVIWAVDPDTSPPTMPYENSFAMVWSMTEADKEGGDALSDAEGAIDANYAHKMRRLFLGYGSADKTKEHFKKICIAVFDSATPGRMGLTFYQELPQDDYLENIVRWHEETSYFLTAWKKEENTKGKEVFVPKQYIGAPSYDDILFAVYGKARGGNDTGYNTLKRKVRKQLLECMFGNFAFPKSMVDMAAVRASRPMSFTDADGKFHPGDWNRSLGIVCALARKYYTYQKEEISLALDETVQKRDYLYGRLLAVADRLEQTALRKAGKSDIRATNAVRLMSAFSVKPYHTFGVIYQQLHPYINQLNGAGYYQSIMDDILVQLAEEYEDNRPLSPLYLLGFSAQRRAFDSKNTKENRKDDENDSAEQN